MGSKYSYPNKTKHKRSLLVVAIIGLLLIGFAVFKISKNTNKLSPDDLLNKQYELAFDKSAELMNSSITFSKDDNHIQIAKKYKEVFLKDSSPEEIEKLEKERLKEGKVDQVETFKKLKIKISGDDYIVNAEGFNETYTRVDEKRIKDSNGIEYIEKNSW